MLPTRGDVSRKNWDVEAFVARAKERERAEAEAESEQLRARKASRSGGQNTDDPFAPKRAWLQKRDYNIDLDSKLGTTEIIASSRGGGFVCKVCDITMKDSNRYLNHVNSRMHQKRLGMSMRVKRSTAGEVREAFQKALKNQRKNSTRDTED